MEEYSNTLCRIKIVIKIILERTKDGLESLIDRDQAVFFPGSSCFDLTSILRIILEQCVESAIHQFVVGFQQ